MEGRCPKCAAAFELVDTIELSPKVLHECRGCHENLETDLRSQGTVVAVREKQKWV